MSEELCNTQLLERSRSILRSFIDDAEEQFYDVWFAVETGIPNQFENFKVFKAFFAVQSDKFYQILFDHDDYSKNDPSTNPLDSNDINTAKISDLSPCTFSFIQKLFYLQDVRIDTQNVIGIMNAAKTYNIPHLLECCFRYILCIDFQEHSSAFFALLHETEQYNNMEGECRQIIDCLQPITDTCQFVQFFNSENKTLFSVLRPDAIIYLLFSARKFRNIHQEYKWQMCLFWAQAQVVQHHSNNDRDHHIDIQHDIDVVSEKMQRYLKYFDFNEMDWSFFIEHVLKNHVLVDAKLVKDVLCGYIEQHYHIFSKHRGKTKVFKTAFNQCVQSQKSFVNDVQTNNGKRQRHIIKTLVQYVQFNTQTIKNKQKQPNLYSKTDALYDNYWKSTSFLNEEESKKQFSFHTFASKHTPKQAQIPSQSVESLHPTLCDSIQDKLASIVFSSTLSDVRFCLVSDHSVHYGFRALFAKHSKAFHAMLFRNAIDCVPSSERMNTVDVRDVDRDTFLWIQSFFYGHKRAVFTRNNVAQIYIFSDAYLLTHLRTLALKFICWMCIDQADKAKDLISIITQLYAYQGNVFWDLFIAQIREYDVAWCRSQCNLIIQHPDFNKLSKGIITSFLFRSGLFRCYSQEMLWHIIVKWCRLQTPPQNNPDLFLQTRLTPFFRFFTAIYELDCVELDTEETLIVVMCIKLGQMNRMMQKQRWSLSGIQNILKHALFVSLPLDIVGHMVANLVSYHNLAEERAWDACVKWSVAQTFSGPRNKTLEPFRKHFKFHTMSVRYFETNVVSRDVLDEYQIMNVYERFCDYHGILATINTKNVIRLCMTANKHSLRRLERFCIEFVAMIDVGKQCTDFLTIISTLFRCNKIPKFMQMMEQYLKKHKWTESQCLNVVNNKKYFHMLPVVLVELLLFKSSHFSGFTEEQLWDICGKWCVAQCCLYRILGIARSASLDEIKEAYKKQAKLWHPDRNKENADEASGRMKQINEAYEILSDTHRKYTRAWYDANHDTYVQRIDKPEIGHLFKRNFEFHTMSIQYFESNVVSRDVLSECEVICVYERFCDQHGLHTTINTKNVTRLCITANKHSLRKLERNCLKYVAMINVGKRRLCVAFLTILSELFRYNKIPTFMETMEQYLKQFKWTKSQCLSVVNNKTYFHMLPRELVSLLLFRSTAFKVFRDEELWPICVNWCEVNSNNSTMQRNEKLRNFVHYFRFQNMDIGFFRMNVEHLNVLTDSETMEINQHFVNRLLRVIQQKNTTIQERNEMIEIHRATIQQRDRTIRQQEATIRQKDNEIRSKDHKLRNRG